MSSKHVNKTSTKAVELRRLHTLRIRTVEHLARRLRCSSEELQKIASEPNAYYKQGQFVDSKGTKRDKTVPLGRLRIISKHLNECLQQLILNDGQHGGVRGKSYISNAKCHVRQPVLLKLDIRRFFPNITTKMVSSAFRGRCRCSPDVSDMIAAISTPFNCLPQGSPHSSMVAAIVVEPMASRLKRLAGLHKGNYSQYVDDITISGPKHIGRLKKLVIKIIQDEGFAIAAEKAKIEFDNEEQAVTGVRINQQLDVTSKTLREVKEMIALLASRETSGPTLPSIEGKIASVKRLNPGAARYLTKQLRHALAQEA